VLAPRPQGAWPRLVCGAQGRFPILQVAALIAVYAYGAVDLGFWNWASVKEVLVLASLAGLASVGQTLLILMGGFDLSIAGFIVSSALVVTVLKDRWHVSFVVALLVAVAVAAPWARSRARSATASRSSRSSSRWRWARSRSA